MNKKKQRRKQKWHWQQTRKTHTKNRLTEWRMPKQNVHTYRWKMALLHCPTRDLMFHSWCKFPTAKADYKPQRKSDFFSYFCWLLRGQCRCALAVSIFTKISAFGWLLRILFDNNRQQTLATFSLNFVFIALLFMHEMYS